MKNIINIIAFFFSVLTLLPAQNNTIEVDGANGNLIAKIYGEDSYGRLGLMSQSGFERIRLSAGSINGNETSLVLRNSTLATGGISVMLEANGNGRININGTNGFFPNTNISLGGQNDNNDLGFLNIYGSQSLAGPKISAFAESNNTGVILVNGPNNSLNILLSYLNNNTSHGGMGVADAAGLSQAGLLVDEDGDGIVFGDMKNFRTDHPTKPDHEIWYACIEGPEAAAYERGTAELKNGECFIPFSEHFSVLINESTMTVNLTPMDADTYGLAVIEKTAKGIRIKEFKDGRGNFQFDWEVKAVRKGYEDFKVVRAKKDFQLGQTTEPH